MEKIIQTLINSWTKGVDTYTHNGSTWLIFTDNKQWVIELTDSKTLWYNYNFFKQIFEFTSMDVVDNQQYITKWVEDNIINGSKNGVNHITSYPFNKTRLIEDAIQNGVKETRSEINITEGEIEDIIDGDVKETIELMNELPNRVKKIIKKGVKHTQERIVIKKSIVDDAIEKGVKLTQFNDNENKSWVEGVIKHGVKETKTPGNGDIVSTAEWMKENNSTSYPKMIDDVIENGVKEVVFYDEHKRGPVNTFGYIDEIIKEGEKINGTYAGGQRQSEKCKSVVEYGTKNPTD